MHMYKHVQTCRYTSNALICLHRHLHADTCIDRQRDTINHQQEDSKIRGRWPATRRLLASYLVFHYCDYQPIWRTWKCSDANAMISAASPLTAAIRMPILSPIASWFYVPIATGDPNHEPHRWSPWTHVIELWTDWPWLCSSTNPPHFLVEGGCSPTFEHRRCYWLYPRQGRWRCEVSTTVALDI